MAISDNTAKLLWGRAAGICSNPSCRDDLTVMLEGGRGFNVGEMAHVIARSAGGPRGEVGGGSDEYENLLLLCPTCHRRIDKAPAGVFPPELLHQWKKDHEQAIRAACNNLVFDSMADLKKFVSSVLAENRALWSSLGPRSGAAINDPGSNLHEAWSLRKLDTVVPNNTKIINVVEANSQLLSPEETAAFIEFKVHASAFERHQYERLDNYPTFPRSFEALMRS